MIITLQMLNKQSTKIVERALEFRDQFNINKNGKKECKRVGVDAKEYLKIIDSINATRRKSKMEDVAPLTITIDGLELYPMKVTR